MSVRHRDVPLTCPSKYRTEIPTGRRFGPALFSTRCFYCFAQLAIPTGRVLAKYKFGQLHHVGSQQPRGVGGPAAVSHGACRSPYRLPYSDGDGGHRLGRCTGSQTGPFGFWGSCTWQVHLSQHLYMLKLGSWGQTSGFQVHDQVIYGLGDLILVLVAFQQPVELAR